MTRERPILFSGEMVRAILDGRKTVTRRAMSPQPTRVERYTVHDPQLGRPVIYPDGWKLNRTYVADEHNAPGTFAKTISVPHYHRYGSPGDHLWVREAWRTARSLDSMSPTEIGERAKAAGYDRPWAPLAYDADGPATLWLDEVWEGWSNRARPSIHMPRWASRLTLEVVSVRAERLHEITDDDALREGVDQTNTSIPSYARTRFERLWDSINGERPGCAWRDNPWVWRIEFKLDEVTP